MAFSREPAVAVYGQMVLHKHIKEQVQNMEVDETFYSSMHVH